MFKLKSLMAPLLLAAALITTCCYSTHIPQEDLPVFTQVSDMDRAVKIEVWMGSRLIQAATGAIVHSSESLGTWIITNGHVVIVEVPDNPLIPGDQSGNKVVFTVRVIFTDGKGEWGRVEAVNMSVNEEGNLIDLALIRVLYSGKVRNSTFSVSTSRLKEGDKVYGFSWAPDQNPSPREGKIILNEEGVLIVDFKRDIIPGNSGTALYGENGKFRGIIWGSKKTNEDSVDGAFVDVVDIRKWTMDLPMPMPLLLIPF